jgi:predicted NUDIX family NTP pyrophosphohydrolase
MSAGLLCYRTRDGTVEVFLVHPGGPFWARKDDGAWSIPKGEHLDGEEPLTAARREFAEETGFDVPTGALIPLAPLKQPSGKVISAWAVEADFDAAGIVSATFTVEWPPRSGLMREFPEVDRAGWFDLVAAERKLTPGQRPFLIDLAARLAPDPTG